MNDRPSNELGVSELSPEPEASTPPGIDTALVGLLTIDTGSGAIMSCNDAFAEVLELSPDDVHGCLVTDFIDDEVRSVATAVIEGIRAGFISSVDGNVDLLRQAGPIGVDCWILALGTDRRHERAIAGVIVTNGTASPPPGASELGFRPSHVDPNRIVLATLDDEWRITEVPPASGGQLGWAEPRAVTVTPRLQELAHPDDVPALDSAFSRRSSSAEPDTFTLRLRGSDEQWLAARVTVSPMRGQVPPRYGLVVWLMHSDEASDSESQRVARLEDQLARIRQVVQVTDADGVAPGSVDLSDLTVRQQEIVQRLLGGHRVDAIARDLYVSPSTVRNHLSAIFEKLGVASQSELIELLRGHSPGDPGGR